MNRRCVRRAAAVVLSSCLFFVGCGADDTDDSDVLECGNGKLDQGELCDVEILPGKAGACPTQCPTDDACEPRVLTGADCDVECVAEPITACRNADNCCPDECDSDSDSDCSTAP